MFKACTVVEFYFTLIHGTEQKVDRNICKTVYSLKSAQD